MRGVLPGAGEGGDRGGDRAPGAAVGGADADPDADADHAGHAAHVDLLEAQGRVLRELQATEALKDNLLAVVSHEFRTPLTAIIGFAQTLRMSAERGAPSPEAVRLAAERIERNGQRLSRLIGNMLAATMDVQPFAMEDHPVRDVIDRVARELTGSSDSEVEVVNHVPDDLRIRMSRDHLRLVLGNLIDNGLKFADPGTTLSIRGRMAGDEVALTFTNRGPEIPVEMREQIFARFVQVDLSDTRPYDGVGLGLHVVSKVCSAHGGALELRCQDGLVVLGITLPAADGVSSRASETICPPGGGPEPAGT